MHRLSLRVLFSFCLVSITMIVLGGCIRQPATLGPVRVLSSGQLEAQGGDDVARVAFVAVRHLRNTPEPLQNAIAQRLSNAGFTLTETPSKAGHILHVSVLSSGQTGEEAVSSAVDAGFGAPIHFSGSGTVAVIADALLVERNVPSPHKARSNAMRSIAGRNAIADSRMRVAILARTPLQGEPLTQALAQRLAEEICRPLEQASPPVSH